MHYCLSIFIGFILCDIAIYHALIFSVLSELERKGSTNKKCRKGGKCFDEGSKNMFQLIQKYIHTLQKLATV
jgi:hypothetical protein